MSVSTHNGTSLLINAQEIRRTYSALVTPGQVIEIRALEASYQPRARYTETLAGYFDNINDLLREVANLHTAMGIYLTLQPVHPDLLHRAQNKLVRQKRDYSTPDKYITGYRWLLVDSDPDRVSNISSTDQEHALALSHSREILQALSELGWPEPLEADSGNGSHLLYALDLQVGDADLVRRVLEGLARRFETDNVHIDTTVSNPSRICKLYGTLACKGDHTHERPHRLSQLLHIPKAQQVVSRACLEAVATKAVVPENRSSTKKSKAARHFDLGQWIQTHQIETFGEESYEGGVRYVLKQCAWDPSHTDKSAVLLQFENGAISASCRHQSCAGKKWEDFRVIFEPDAYSRFPSSNASETEEEKEARRQKLALRLVELVESCGDLFTTSKGERYARVQVRGHWESLLLESKSFQRWLLHQYVTTYGSIPNKTALESAIEVLEGRAQFGDTPAHEVFLRLASHQGNLYLDLGNAAHEAVEITAAGWRILTDPPVCFRRAQGTLPLSRPEPGGKLSELRSFLHVGDEDWLLIQAWLLGTFHPRGPYAILALSGEHGSAKSTTTQLLRSLVDPAKAPLRKEPRDDQTFAIMAHNNYIVALDNLSHLSARLSDNLCTLATGAGDAYRKLYANDEETLFEDCRPQIFNGIEELATRGDLIDRCLHIKLLPFEEGEREDEQSYWQRFEQAQPRILGGLLDAVSASLRNLAQTTIAHKPRMADFALWVQAAESMLTSTPGAFLDAYWKNRAEGTVEELDSSPVGIAIFQLLQKTPIWTGTTTDLKKELEKIAGEQMTRSKNWPGNPRVLAGILKRLAPSLRAQQVHIESGYKGRSRYITLSMTASIFSPENPPQVDDPDPIPTQHLQECNANNAGAMHTSQPCVVVSGASTSQMNPSVTQTMQEKTSLEELGSLLSTNSAKPVSPQEEEYESASQNWQPCATRYEQFKQGSHQAVGVLFSCGLWWCQQCELQRLLMETGERLGYPELQLVNSRIRAGKVSWLRFATEAGYTVVGKAVQAARHMEAKR